MKTVNIFCNAIKKAILNELENSTIVEKEDQKVSFEYNGKKYLVSLIDENYSSVRIISENLSDGLNISDMKFLKSTNKLMVYSDVLDTIHSYLRLSNE